MESNCRLPLPFKFGMQPHPGRNHSIGFFFFFGGGGGGGGGGAGGSSPPKIFKMAQELCVLPVPPYIKV
jgi:hypothetical protein